MFFIPDLVSTLTSLLAETKRGKEVDKNGEDGPIKVKVVNKCQILKKSATINVQV